MSRNANRGYLLPCNDPCDETVAQDVVAGTRQESLTYLLNDFWSHPVRSANCCLRLVCHCVDLPKTKG